MIIDTNKMMNAAIDAEAKRLGLVVAKPDTRPSLDEVAEQAASEVELELEEIDIRDNAGRDMGSKQIPVPAQDSISIDVTDALQREMEGWGEGSFVQSFLDGEVRVNARLPQLFVVDADGNHIVGARIMSEFSDITVDAP